MKNLFKLFLVVVGMSVAAYVSSNKLSARVAPSAGYCSGSANICGVTPGGFTAYGFFHTN